jgi:hypothetical protein
LTKNGLGHIFGDFFINTSGHTDLDPHVDEKAPKFIVEGGRVLQHKDEKVPGTDVMIF